MQYRMVLTGLALTLALGGCIFAPDGGGNRDRAYDRVQPTTGQELLDLDRAREQGVISDTEFERARNRILDNI